MKLYTKTVCPKCMFTKLELSNAGLDGQYEVINIDHNDEARQKLMNANILAVPVLEADGRLIYEQSEISAYIEQLA